LCTKNKNLVNDAIFMPKWRWGPRKAIYSKTLRSYFKVYGPSDESFVSPTRVNPEDRAYAMLISPSGTSRKTFCISNYNFFSGYGIPNQNALVWYLIDTTTGTPPGGGTIVTSFNGIALAHGLYPLRTYSLHPRD